uniref:Bridge-like lipid transfer protein family member 1 C-terminal domain-containing protein n=1 Tax=Timema shepardi TaxID=629360 RepID=A0A7R9FW30_TIMSH|nr:unnamed protein product [Timema shepardi]
MLAHFSHFTSTIIAHSYPEHACVFLQTNIPTLETAFPASIQLPVSLPPGGKVMHWHARTQIEMFAVFKVGPSGSVLRAHSPENDRRNKDFVVNSSSATEEDRKRKAFDPAEMFTKDWRNYHCKTWHLEPTVRLLSWAGKSIEPYGVDYILQKLGFSHARTTIPKWMQRGFMDPLDKVLAVLMFRMITVVREESSGEADYQTNK